jgi:hypothetical protein
MSFKERIQRAIPIWRQMLERLTPFVRQAIVVGGSAGVLTVAAIKKGDQLVGVVKLPEIAQVSIAGGSAGDHTVTGITTADKLISVINLADGVDLTSEFSITAADTINNAAGTDTTSDQVQVTYQEVFVDLTSEFVVNTDIGQLILVDAEINNAGGTATTAAPLIVTWLAWAE